MSMGPKDSSYMMMLERMTPEQKRQNLLAVYEMSKRLRAIPGHRPSIAQGIQNQTDYVTQKVIAVHPQGKDISCRRGCNACCYIHVTVDNNEAKQLAMVVREKEIAIDRELLARQAIAHGPDEWQALPHADKLCVFNNPTNGECRIYPHRPRACRKYFVVSPPELCDLEKNTGQDVSRLVVSKAESLDAAAFLAFGDAGSLPSALQRELNR